MRSKNIRLLVSVVALYTLSGCALFKGQTLSMNTTKAATIETKSAKPYHAIIARHARENGVPVSLAHAVVYSESSYKANARGAAGEIGLMQLRLPTARMVGYKGSPKALYHPETNIKFGMRYLGKAHQLSGGKTCGTILKYNAGHGAKRMNPISKRYCNKVQRLLK